MEYILSEVEPKDVLRYFEQISAIPHGSYHVDEISDFIAQFAKEQGLEYIQDEEKNVIIFKPAQGAAADAAPIMLQGHIDMVLEKIKENPINMETEPIRLILDGDILHADGTTLGGDDGIAVAMMMAALADKEMVHPALECIFTTNEETGMDGMVALDPAPLKAKRLINLDSEEEGIFTVGCAGGSHQEMTLPINRSLHNGTGLHLTVSGLKGGHSGACIHLGRANADYIMIRLLHKLMKKEDLRLKEICGGGKDNAIPRECEATVLLDTDVDREKLEKKIKSFCKDIEGEYRYTDPDIDIRYEWIEYGQSMVEAVSKKETKNIVRLFMAMPNGLIESDPNIKDMPQTSLNLGILDTQEDEIRATFLIRSSINSQKKLMSDKVKIVAEAFGAEMNVGGTYPAWEYAPESPLRDMMIRVYKEETGKDPVISITHGGLECGLLASKIEGLDSISIGPDMEGIHTPDEKLDLASVRRCWSFLKAVLREAAK